MPILYGVRRESIYQYFLLKTVFLKLLIFSFFLFFCSISHAEERIAWSHAIAMHGQPALPADFPHLPYANPNAPKGGQMKVGVQGTFDSLNQFILKGAWTTARGMKERQMGSNIFESLLMRSSNEAFSLYAHIAESVRMPDTRNWIEFRLNQAAQFSNKTPITVEDIIFSLQLLRDKGRPPYSGWYKQITKFEQTGERSVKLHFKDGNNRELPLLISLAPIFSKAATNVETFDQSTLTPPLGSGPYTVSEVQPGRRIVYKRNPNYWGKNLPVKIGFDNFDEIIIDYYRDSNALHEAFKKGDVYAMQFESPNFWVNGFNFPAFQEGRVFKEVFEKKTPANMDGIAFNTRLDKFNDKNVRRALSLLLDFKFINRTLFNGVYARTAGYWDNSELSSIGRPASKRERALLVPYSSQIPENILNGTWFPTETDGSGHDRKVLHEAINLLRKAGYTLKNRQMVDAKDGTPLEFELLVRKKEEERVALSLQRIMERIGISMVIRTVDASQFEQRRANFEFEMLFNRWWSSLSPGAEQYSRWSSSAAKTKGSRNIVGASDPAIDELTSKIVAARTKQEFIDSVRAFDRVLISGFYAIPLYHNPAEWVGRWQNVSHPEYTPIYGYQYDNWWAKN
ncbi:extracellular solute-binding protein [Flexibacterium corallicola]|uniref:extracellular solute-binding protein n=1 Tax=Flexibacterium corallicola TaxID=3037259 RepID=UPI00286EF27C|nr:extracellular solute-binding protein [Pseudovibrio sp. M1P-2-3]